MDDEQQITIKIIITPRKLAKLVEIMPDYENDGKTNTAVYWAINEVIRNATAKPQVESRQHHSNRDYLNIRRS